MTCGQRRALHHRSREGLHHQNSLKSVLERERVSVSSTLWRALNMKYITCKGLVEAGKRGSRLHSTHRVLVEESNQ